MSAPSGMAALQRDCKDHLNKIYQTWETKQILNIRYQTQETMQVCMSLLPYSFFYVD